MTGHNTEARALRTQTEGRHVEVGGQVMDAANFLNHYYEAQTSAAMQIRENQNQENMRVTEENQAENENNAQESAEDADNGNKNIRYKLEPYSEEERISLSRYNGISFY